MAERPTAPNEDLLALAGELAKREQGLTVVVTLRTGGTAHASVVNAGIMAHPITSERCIGFVAQGRSQRKLANLRARPSATVVFRSGRDWVAIDGLAELAQPDEPLAGMTNQDTVGLFHEIYSQAIGGTPDDWTSRDNVIEAEGHVAVVVTPLRVYSSTPAT